ncbi:isoleucine--tRNA ligase, partial [Candidatus Hodarchaeum mangrovi]
TRRFGSLDSTFNWLEVENEVSQLWENIRIFDKVLKRQKDLKDKFSFIDGPVTANNPMGVHTARGRTLKDIVQRYYTLSQKKQRFQNGFDTQGLWVEVEVEKSLGIKSKNEILVMGLEEFVGHCKERVSKYSEVITNQSKLLGQQMKWENSYYTHEDKNIEHIWHFLKKCHSNGWLYQKQLVMPWCPRCGTSLSNHEMADSYQMFQHPSVYLSLPLKDTPNISVLVWTTTPWTLLANVALAVNPTSNYLLIKAEKKEFIVAESLVDSLFTNYKTINIFKGRDLENKEYIGPFEEISFQGNIKHKIVCWKDVLITEGTGIVHIAPGCGAEDFELGNMLELDILCPINEQGLLIVPPFKNLSVQEAKDPILSDLSRKNFIFKVEEIEHRYPVCWRCKTELVFKLVSEWFISCGEIKPLLRQANSMVNWIPEYAEKRMDDWLINMGDWCISRKRFWGLPLPFYPCSCGKLTVIGNKDELKAFILNKNDFKELQELHKPWIDRIKIKCPSCGKAVSRISEVGDCWLDAGIVPFSTLNYLNDRKYWQEWFPADLVCEMVEQVRLWFYSLLFMSVTLEGIAPYKRVMVYEAVKNQDGSDMHKSAFTNKTLSFDETRKILGSDSMRWYYACQKADTILNFNLEDALKFKSRFIPVWNAVRFFVNLASLDIQEISQLKKKSENVFDQWILSRLKELNKQYHQAFALGDLRSPVYALESFFDDLTNKYIRVSRRRFWKTEGDLEEKEEAYSTLYTVLINLSVLLSPFMPFFAEKLYQSLRFPLDQTLPESVHLFLFKDLEVVNTSNEAINDVNSFFEIIEQGRSLRSKAKIKLRQPLSNLVVESFELLFTQTLWEDQLIEAVKKELNVKNVNLCRKFNFPVSTEDYISTTFNGKFRLYLRTEITIELESEGNAREIVRIVQNLRKSHYLNLETPINILYTTSDLKLIQSIEQFSNFILKETIGHTIIESAKIQGKKYLVNGSVIYLKIDVSLDP